MRTLGNLGTGAAHMLEQRATRNVAVHLRPVEGCGGRLGRVRNAGDRHDVRAVAVAGDAAGSAGSEQRYVIQVLDRDAVELDSIESCLIH